MPIQIRIRILTLTMKTRYHTTSTLFNHVRYYLVKYEMGQMIIAHFTDFPYEAYDRTNLTQRILNNPRSKVLC